MMWWIGAAMAQQVTVTVDPEVAQQVGIDPTEVQQQVSERISGAFRLPDQTEFLRQMADANAMASKGMGVDYATNPQRFVVGASFGSAVNGVGATFLRGTDTLPEGGFSVQLSAMGALNLGLQIGRAHV